MATTKKTKGMGKVRTLAGLHVGDLRLMRRDGFIDLEVRIFPLASIGHRSTSMD